MDRIESSLRAEAVLGAGRGALVRVMFGSGWLGWGLGQARAFNGFTAPAFGSITLLLLVCSLYFLRQGRILRKRFPADARPAILKGYLLIVLMEVVLILLVLVLADRLHRPDLATDWCAMVVGLHFLPLARLFRAPSLTVLGILVTLWCALCWALFRSNTLAIAASIGTGVLLCVSCVYSLLRAGRFAHSLLVEGCARQAE